MKATKGQLRSGFTLVELLVVISIIVVLAGLSVPVAMKALGKAEQVTGISNVGNIKKAMDLFAGDFDGEYPSDDTAEELGEILSDTAGSSSKGGGLGNKSRLDKSSRLSDREGRRGNSGRSSNSDKPSNFYFTQIMGRGLDDEKLFYQKSFKKAFILSKPDMNRVVDKGECVWAYTKNLQQTSSSHIPVIYDTPISTGDSPRFSKKVWDGKVIVAKLDNSTSPIIIGGTDPKEGAVTGKVDGERINIFSQEGLEEGTLVPADLSRLGSSN